MRTAQRRASQADRRPRYPVASRSSDLNFHNNNVDHNHKHFDNGPCAATVKHHHHHDDNDDTHNNLGTRTDGVAQPILPAR